MLTRSTKYEVRLAAPARRDLAAIMEWTVGEFGWPAARRYDTLIKQALKDIGADPERPGSKSLQELMIAGVRIYHLGLSRRSVRGQGVKAPRHFILYRVRPDHVIEVARIIHDSRDLRRHVPDEYRIL